MAALRGSRLCYNHSPGTARKRIASRRNGGRRTRVPNARTPLSVATIAELQQHIGQALADARMHGNSLQRSMVVARLVLAAVKLIEVGEVEQRFVQIED
ncbi:MAG TPA: hypothetical protein VFT29_00330, partial [Gemmatimonadaceae bacterium]|nr:hypothetical protein [Gemmatimonadaceae bacterium]